MKGFNLCGWLLSYDLLKISTKLVIPLKHNKIFAKFLEILWDNNVTSSQQTFVDKAKIIWKSFMSLYFPIFLRALSHQNVLKIALKKINAPRF